MPKICPKCGATVSGKRCDNLMCAASNASSRSDESTPKLIPNTRSAQGNLRLVVFSILGTCAVSLGLLLRGLKRNRFGLETQQLIPILAVGSFAILAGGLMILRLYVPARTPASERKGPTGFRDVLIAIAVSVLVGTIATLSILQVTNTHYEDENAVFVLCLFGIGGFVFTMICYLGFWLIQYLKLE